MFRNNRCYDMNSKLEDSKMSDMSMTCPEMAPSCPPVTECPQERCCHREFVHEVPHIIPINTRIINHHVYRHTYTPCYTYCEENEVSNVYERNNCCF